MATGKDNSGRLFGHIKAAHQLKNDAALARLLGVAASAISKIRHGSMAVSPALILAVHEKAGLPVADIRKLMAAE